MKLATRIRTVGVEVVGLGAFSLLLLILELDETTANPLHSADRSFKSSSILSQQGVTRSCLYHYDEEPLEHEALLKPNDRRRSCFVEESLHESICPNVRSSSWNGESLANFLSASNDRRDQVKR